MLWGLGHAVACGLSLVTQQSAVRYHWSRNRLTCRGGRGVPREAQDAQVGEGLWREALLQGLHHRIVRAVSVVCHQQRVPVQKRHVPVSVTCKWNVHTRGSHRRIHTKGFTSDGIHNQTGYIRTFTPEAHTEFTPEGSHKRESTTRKESYQCSHQN